MVIQTGYPNLANQGRIIAHRGASQVAPENTLAAFRAAKEQGVNWVEFDVSLLGDMTPVVHHDATLDRCTDAEGPLAQISASDLATIHAGKLYGATFAQEKLPNLDAVLDLLDATGMYANLEMKLHGSAPGTLADAVHFALSMRPWSVKRIIVSSFDHDELAALRSCMPEVAIAALWEQPPCDFRRTLSELQAAALHLSYAYLSQGLLQEAISYGYDVRVYTVNNPSVMAPFRAFGLTSVITDHPPLFLNDPDWAMWANEA